MKISEMTVTVERMIKAKIVPLIQSSPGVGKSSIVHQIAEKYNLKLIDLRLASSDPTDLSGLPHPLSRLLCQHLQLERR